MYKGFSNFLFFYFLASSSETANNQKKEPANPFGSIYPENVKIQCLHKTLHEEVKVFDPYPLPSEISKNNGLQNVSLQSDSQKLVNLDRDKKPKRMNKTQKDPLRKVGGMTFRRSKVKNGDFARLPNAVVGNFEPEKLPNIEGKLSKLLFELRCLCGFRLSVCVCLSASANFLMVAYIKEC